MTPPLELLQHVLVWLHVFLRWWQIKYWRHGHAYCTTLPQLTPRSASLSWISLSENAISPCSKRFRSFVRKNTPEAEASRFASATSHAAMSVSRSATLTWWRLEFKALSTSPQEKNLNSYVQCLSQNIAQQKIHCI